MVEVLIEGYVRSISNTEWEASATSTLITSEKGTYILVDPGSNKKLLLGKLKEKEFVTSDIHWVFITHHHPDHMKNIALFSQAKLVDVEGIYEHDHGEVISSVIPDTDIQIIKTPGHEHGHASLLVPTQRGIVAVAGDVFWWSEGEEQILDVEKPDDFATDMEKLKESRRYLLKQADWIIPGHGKMQPV